jgi:hypothetical protein
MTTVFACCFCKRSIAYLGADPVILTARSHKDDEDNTQELYCHAACLHEAIPKMNWMESLDIRQ